jgi:hypothetical protein
MQSAGFCTDDHWSAGSNCDRKTSWWLGSESEVFAMNTQDPTPRISSDCVDVVMKELPEMFCSLGFAGDEEFVYGVTYFSVQEEQRRGATPDQIRAQRSQILRRIDATNRPPHDSEVFASLFARAVEDALEGREPCVLH